MGDDRKLVQAETTPREPLSELATLLQEKDSI
jgi:hypothetical protein